MGIEVASAFTRKSTQPIDDSLIVADTTARDALDAGIRYEGMIVYSVADETNFQLVGGITNGDWSELSGSGGTPTPFGTYSSPRSVSASVGITTAAGHFDKTLASQIVFLKSSTAGAVTTVSANPQIEAGTIVGQRLGIQGASDDDLLIFNDGNGLRINGPWTSFNKANLWLYWDGQDWVKENIG